MGKGLVRGEKGGEIFTILSESQAWAGFRRKKKKKKKRDEK